MKRWRLLCTLLQWLIFIIHFNKHNQERIFKLEPHSETSFFWLDAVECDEFTYFASCRRLRSLMRLFCMSCTQPSQSGDSAYLNFHVFSFIVWAIFSPFGFPCWRSNSHVARNPLNILYSNISAKSELNLKSSTISSLAYYMIAVEIHFLLHGSAGRKEHFILK